MMAAVNNTPAWYSKEEAKCFEKVKELARKILSAKSVIVDPEEIHIVIECRTALSTDDILLICDFNEECPEVPVSYAYESDRVKGKRYDL